MSAGTYRDFLRSVGYRLVRHLARFLLGLFYRRVEIVGSEHIPTSGPVIFAVNHHNSIVDAMLLLAALPRRLVTLAKAPLFRHPLIGPFLRLLGALPVHRRQLLPSTRAATTWERLAVLSLFMHSVCMNAQAYVKCLFTSWNVGLMRDGEGVALLLSSPKVPSGQGAGSSGPA